MKLKFGATAPKLADQLRGQGLHPLTLDHFQLDSDAVCRLMVRGLITVEECIAIRKRLVEDIEKAVKEAKGEHQ